MLRRRDPGTRRHGDAETLKAEVGEQTADLNTNYFAVYFILRVSASRRLRLGDLALSQAAESLTSHCSLSLTLLMFLTDRKPSAIQ